jgi:hypothetical protein
MTLLLRAILAALSSMAVMSPRFARGLMPFEEFADVDDATVYPPGSDALWVRGAGSTDITDFMQSLTVLSKLRDGGATVTFQETGTTSGEWFARKVKRPTSRARCID